MGNNWNIPKVKTELFCNGAKNAWKNKQGVFGLKFGEKYAENYHGLRKGLMINTF